MMIEETISDSFNLDFEILKNFTLEDIFSQMNDLSDKIDFDFTSF